MDFSTDKFNEISKGTLMETLDIKYVTTEKGYIVATMPVNASTHQPDGILHGGANLALAETVAGLGSVLIIDHSVYSVRGAQVSANHVGTVKTGLVTANGKLIHKGKNTHVWNIDIVDEDDRLISTCRITNVIVKK
jgi:1,4-dihydroxy-2-naphthoyl-CoA hydrolase